MLATFSLHSVVNSVGAWCGLAALIGLALLALLYFAHARELRRLSDWVAGEEDRRRLSPGPVTRATLIPQAAQPQQPPSPGGPAVAAQPGGVVTTAVPGARRVAVPGAATPGPAAVLAPATAAAAAAVQAPAEAPEQANGDGPPGAGEPPPSVPTRVVAIPVAAPDLPAEPFADDPAAPAADAAPSAAPADAGDDLESADDLAEPTGRGAEAPATAFDAAGERAGDQVAGPPQAPAPAAVPLRVRRIPVAEPQGGAGAEHEVQAAASPFDLLRADPPLADELEPGAATGDMPSLGPSTAAGARPRFPPPPGAPPVRVSRPRDRDDVTVRVPGRAAPGTDRTERRRPERVDDYEDEPPRSFASTLRLLVAAIVIVAILIFVATRLFSSSSNPPANPPAHSSTTQSQSSGPTAPAVVASHITVAVLNGTTTAHLASGAWALLASSGFRKGAVANAAASNVATSKVAYTRHHRRAALVVAQALGLSAAQVGPVHAATLAQAERNGRRPQVVVTLGADYAQR